MKAQTFFKLRHISSGKFYKPASGYGWTKNNLSPTGKVYSRKAINFKSVSRIYVSSKEFPDAEDLSWRNTNADKVKVIQTQIEDWEWVEFQVIEKSIHKLS